MAESKNTMVRLDRLEGALVHLTDLLVLQGERMDYGFSALREEMRATREEMRITREEARATREEMHGMREEMHSVRDETRSFRESVTDRLDRLIAMTTKERTSGAERLLSIEQRLARLEERVGLE